MRSIFKPKQNISGPKVFVGLSGGVDSAVSAALLKERGYEVTGVFIRIVVPGYPCTAGQDRIDAMRVAAHLGIPFIEIDLSKEYTESVFKPTIAEYAHGETPNPDTLCNKEIKFGKFYEFARSYGVDFIATGHYARIVHGGGSSRTRARDVSSLHPEPMERISAEELLFAGLDADKDQSYFLWSVPQEVLRHTLFPVGGMVKEEVRAYAKKAGLPNASRPDSQGLCFLGPVSIDEMLRQELTLTPGKVLSEEGVVVGAHEGAQRYTLGQRHGFVLQSHTPKTMPHFVIAKDIAKNTITVSTSRFPKLALKTNLSLRNSNWIGEVKGGPCSARYRYRQPLIPALLEGDTVVLHEPHYTPVGQSLVLYRGERCLGGGVIESATLS